MRAAPEDFAREELDQKRHMVMEAMRALVGGMPERALAIVDDYRQKPDAPFSSYMIRILQRFTSSYADYETLLLVIEIMAKMQSGVFESGQGTRLEQFMRSRDSFVALTAEWAMDNHHLAEGRREQADALFAALAEKAPPLSVFHRPSVLATPASV